MKNYIKQTFLSLVIGFGFVANAAALTVNAPIAITHQVTVQLIQTDNEAGTLAGMFGDPGTQTTIFGHIDTIWAQAGIDINFLPTVNTYSNAFAFEGTLSPRPSGDLNTIIDNGVLAGVSNPNPLVLNLYMVDVVPGSSKLADNFVNGLAFRPGNGIAMYVGSELLTTAGGLEAVASVTAHEIGHNLGLPHVDPASIFENLLCGFPYDCSISEGERLEASQIALAQASPFAVALVPIPAAVWMFGCAMVMLIGVRRQQAA